MYFAVLEQMHTLIKVYYVILMGFQTYGKILTFINKLYRASYNFNGNKLCVHSAIY